MSTFPTVYDEVVTNLEVEESVCCNKYTVQGLLAYIIT